MASIRERIKAVLTSRVTLGAVWGAAFLANASLVALGLLQESVRGAVAAMLGAIAAALMIFSLLLKDKAEESEAAAVGSAKSGEAEAGEE